MKWPMSTQIQKNKKNPVGRMYDENTNVLAAKLVKKNPAVQPWDEQKEKRKREKTREKYSETYKS